MSKWKHFIDSHKGATPLVVLGLMTWFEQWESPTAWVYLGLHGTYGILWVLKSRIFPDRAWEAPASLWRGLYIWGGLTLYWISPYLITSQGLQAPAWLMGLAVSMFGFGVFFHYTSDMQKYIALKYNPGQLITDGLMSRVRNINYFGEFLIYASFAALSMSWIPFVVIAMYLAIIWIPNMVKKEKSLARYPEFEAYRKRARAFLPFIF